MTRYLHTYRQDGDFFIGHLNDFPAYETQGETGAELADHLTSLLQDIDSGGIPYLHRTDEHLARSMITKLTHHR